MPSLKKKRRSKTDSAKRVSRKRKKIESDDDIIPHPHARGQGTRKQVRLARIMAKRYLEKAKAKNSYYKPWTEPLEEHRAWYEFMDAAKAADDINGIPLDPKVLVDICFKNWRSRATKIPAPAHLHSSQTMLQYGEHLDRTTFVAQKTMQERVDDGEDPKKVFGHLISYTRDVAKLMGMSHKKTLRTELYAELPQAYLEYEGVWTEKVARRWKKANEDDDVTDD